MKTKPEWFKPLCILALVLGVIGMCCDVIGSSASFLNAAATPGLSAEQQAAMAQVMAYRPFTLAVAALNIIQCAVMSVGAALCLKDPLRYGPVLRAGLLAGLVLVPIGLVLGLFIQTSSQKGMLSSTALGEGFGTAVMGMTWVFGIGWSLAKVAFFWLTLKTLETQSAPAPAI